jgi:CheY-like chemotaxis protein
VLSLAAANFEVDEHYAAMTPGTKAGPHVLFTVSDTGTGIPPQILDKIFDPFFTTKGIGTGTGLGLSTVLGIVKGHGGAITADSTPHGTTFRVLLPAASAPLDDIGANPAVELLPGNGETILVVDDEEAIRSVASLLLVSQGYKVLLAEDGPSALSIFAAHAHQIDVVLTDFAMPTMTGFTLARTLLRIRPNVPIIISAGRQEDYDTTEIDEIGIAATLPKPYSQASLLQLLAQTLSTSKVTI